MPTRSVRINDIFFLSGRKIYKLSARKKRFKIGEALFLQIAPETCQKCITSLFTLKYRLTTDRNIYFRV